MAPGAMHLSDTIPKLLINSETVLAPHCYLIWLAFGIYSALSEIRSTEAIIARTSGRSI